MDTQNIIKTLSQSLLDEVKKVMKKEKSEKTEKGESEADEKAEHCSEALKGDQHKIDANKNGKVDAHDFKLLRKKKGVAETYAEMNSDKEISEEDEVEEAVKNPYAVGMAAAMKSTGDTPPLKKSTITKAHEIAKKVAKEEVEEIDEGNLENKIKKNVFTGKLGKDLARKRGSAFYSDAKKAGRDILRKEEVESIDEISAKVVDSYREKAYAQQPAGDDGSQLYKKRKAGRDTAFKKVTHGAKVPATNEEVELTQEEIDRLDAIMADLDEARGRPPKEGSEAWKKRQEMGAAEQDEPRQHPIQQLERIKRDMRGGSEFKHKDGTTHQLTGTQAAKLLDKYHGLRPSEKEEMQKDIHANHAGLKKHL